MVKSESEQAWASDMPYDRWRGTGGLEALARLELVPRAGLGVGVGGPGRDGHAVDEQDAPELSQDLVAQALARLRAGDLVRLQALGRSPNPAGVVTTDDGRAPEDAAREKPAPAPAAKGAESAGMALFAASAAHARKVRDAVESGAGRAEIERTSFEDSVALDSWLEGVLRMATVRAAAFLDGTLMADEPLATIAASASKYAKLVRVALAAQQALARGNDRRIAAAATLHAHRPMKPLPRTPDEAASDVAGAPRGASPDHAEPRPSEPSAPAEPPA
jgi:hypothetical protein